MAGKRGPKRGGRGTGRRNQPPRKAADAPPDRPLRLQAFLARAGVASRRASEEIITAGRVAVNGTRVTELGSKVTPGRDKVTVDGKPAELARTVWLALNKPRGYVTTRDDPRDRRTVYDLLPDRFSSLFHVGRLDRQSQGLLLFTNDGALANNLLHPRYELTREYYADVEGWPGDDALRTLVTGVELDDGVAQADAVQVLRPMGDDLARVVVVLREGRNREVRRMFEAVGHPVVRLQRRRFGPFELGDLKPGRWRLLTSDEIAALRAASGQESSRPPAPPAGS